MSEQTDCVSRQSPKEAVGGRKPFTGHLCRVHEQLKGDWVYTPAVLLDRPFPDLDGLLDENDPSCAVVSAIGAIYRGIGEGMDSGPVYYTLHDVDEADRSQLDEFFGNGHAPAKASTSGDDEDNAQLRRGVEQALDRLRVLSHEGGDGRAYLKDLIEQCKNSGEDVADELADCLTEIVNLKANSQCRSLKSELLMMILSIEPQDVRWERKDAADVLEKLTRALSRKLMEPDSI